MTVKINADTSDGLKFVSDTSGTIDLQSNGTTRVSMDAAGNLTATSFVGSGANLTGLGGGITQADIWRLTSNVTSDTGGVSAFERADDAATTKVGDGISFSTPYFSFPETGIYLIQSQVQFAPTNDIDNVIWSTVYYNGSSSNTLAECQGSDGNTSSFSQCILDVTNTTNDKLYFSVASLASGGNITGNTNVNNTCVLFLRLGDT
jgi:hypothetical protein